MPRRSRVEYDSQSTIDRSCGYSALSSLAWLTLHSQTFRIKKHASPFTEPAPVACREISTKYSVIYDLQHVVDFQRNYLCISDVLDFALCRRRLQDFIKIQKLYNRCSNKNCYFFLKVYMNKKKKGKIRKQVQNMLEVELDKNGLVFLKSVQEDQTIEYFDAKMLRRSGFDSMNDSQSTIDGGGYYSSVIDTSQSNIPNPGSTHVHSQRPRAPVACREISTKYSVIYYLRHAVQQEVCVRSPCVLIQDILSWYHDFLSSAFSTIGLSIRIKGRACVELEG